MKRKTKRITKEPLHLLRNRCDGLWRDAVLSRWGGKCKVCNKNEATQAHHIFHKGANNAFRFHLRNGLPVCTGCHLREKYNPSVVVMRAIETHGSEMHLLWTEVKRHAGRHVWTRAQLEAVEARMREVVTT
jgi:hypothetical protein